MLQGGNSSCILNAANEIAVEAFLQERLSFTAMPEVIEKTMETVNFIKHPSLDDYVETDKESRKVAEEWVEKIK